MGKHLTIFFSRLVRDTTRPVGISNLLIIFIFYDVSFYLPFGLKGLGEKGGKENV
jgi:hypothetical protein